MEIERIHEIEQAIGVNRSEVLRLGVSILFLAGALWLNIAAAWIITVPVSGFLAAMLFFMISGMMLP